VSHDRVRYREDDRAIQLALFRYGVIAPLVEQARWVPGERVQRVREITAATHYQPGRGPLRISERTIYGWLRLYHEGGIEALRPRRRKDGGRSRKLDRETLDRAVELRQENPKRTTATLLDILEREKTLARGAAPHRATLDRHLARRGASRRDLRRDATPPTIKMQFEAFGDLWVGDYHHGPLVLDPRGKPTTAKLGAFLDHTTRYPVAYRYHLAEDLTSLRDVLLRALLTWGCPKKVYVDRGAVFRSDQLAFSLQTVGTVLIHSRPYYSQGRGVIEKWWQVVIPFEDEVRLRPELLSIHELNVLLESWVDLRYGEVEHRELGQSPREAIASVTPRPLDPEVARDLFLVRVERTVNKKTSCVSVEGQEFLCERFLRGRRVAVRYDPADFTSVLVFRDGQRVQRAFPRRTQTTPPRPETPEIPPPPSVDYLALLREDYERKLLEHARPLAYASLEVEPRFDEAAFSKVLADLAGLDLTPSTRREITSFWETFGPFPEELVRIAAEHAIRLHGRGRHPRLYLHALRTLVLAHWRHPRKDPP